MCGIVGFCNFSGEPANANVITAMSSALRHRGPHGMGHIVSGSLALGHTRLAILDLTDAGKQPMSTDNGLFTIVYNGEVYNWQELRSVLQGQGHVFHSRTDTEVVLHAYQEWGKNCIHKLNGMYAFCIYDARRRKLFIARDRYGIKPLYYYISNKIFIFSSESKAFLQHPHFSPRIDEEALVEYFTFQNIFSQKTFFKDVSLFPAGCTAEISLNDPGKMHIERFWDFQFHPMRNPPSLAEAEEELTRLFQQAVSRQMVSDTEVGTYLSGGVDSGSITAVASRVHPHLKSFTCGFDMRSASGMEIGFDERERSEYLSYLFQTEHYEIVLKSGDMERAMPLLAWHMEEPRLGQSYPNYYAAKLASKMVRVVLSGSGGDELFAGYPWRYYRVLDCKSFEEYVDRYYTYWQRLLPNRLLNPLFSPMASKVRHVWTRDIFRNVFGPDTEVPDCPEKCITLSLYFEARTFLAGLLLLEDKLSMSHGLETRLPFLDNDLVDFVQALPVAYKLKNLATNTPLDENLLSKSHGYFQRHADGKHILRQMMSRLVPQDVANAVKQGFSGPDASWFRGESVEYLRRILLNPTARIWEYLDYGIAKQLINEHFSGKENRRLFIWSLLSVEWWLCTFL